MKRCNFFFNKLKCNNIRGRTVKAIIWGIGKEYKKRKEELCSSCNIIAYTDNDYMLWGTSVDGVGVIAPDSISKYRYDVIIICTTKYRFEIRNQLLEMGISVKKVAFIDYYLLRSKRGEITYLNDSVIEGKRKKSVLIVTTDMNYNGGKLAAVYAAQALISRSYKVLMIAPSVNVRLQKEMVSRGIPLAIVPALLNPGEDELEISKKYDAVIVNVYQNIIPACEYSKLRPTLWWIHESRKLIDITNNEFAMYAQKSRFEELNVKAVCKNVRENMLSVWSDLEIGIMSYGIPDFFVEQKNAVHEKKIVFAVVGHIEYRKGQDIFAKAVKEYNKICTVGAEFWIIGSNEGDFFSNVMSIAQNTDNIYYKGELSREELEKIYPDIDAVVCTSRQEGMPIVVNEGLMNRKVCIVADTAGDNDKIEEGINGFFFHGENIEELAQKMKYVAEHFAELDSVRDHARKTYLENYSLDAFADRLEDAVDETIRTYKSK